MSASDELFENSRFTARQVLWAIIVLGAAVRLWMVFTAAGINSDAWRYALRAEKMAREGLLAGMRGEFLWPYYPLNRNLITYPFLGSLLVPFTGDAILSLRLVSAGAGVGLVPLGYAITKRLFDKEGIALVAALLLAVHSEFARASASVYREVLAAFVVTLAFYLVLRAREGGRDAYSYAGGCGLVLFLAFVTRPETLVAAAGCGLLLLFLGEPALWRERIKASAVMALAFVLLEVPYVLWMHRETGLWMVNQWQITRKVDEDECWRRHLQAGENR
jgi:4-amino-4-deoxy-L-arabinose transferase-like glycosyltransferase